MIEKIIRNSIKSLEPYEPYNYEYRYKLDANENPFSIPDEIYDRVLKKLKDTKLNRYPDSNSLELKEALAQALGINEKNIIMGNGSDEMINVILNTFIDNEDIVISHSPTFSMYKISTVIAGGQYIGVVDESIDKINTERIINTANEKEAKIIFLCSPNNPTGSIIDKKDIIRIIENTVSIVVVDEAYIEFGGETMLEDINSYERLIILRTLSKAYGGAGIRTGYIIGSEKIIRALNKVKPPYNLNTISQIIALELIKNGKLVEERVNFINKERKEMYEKLLQVKGIEVYKSKANFLLFKVEEANEIFSKLLSKGIMVRAFDGEILKNHIRVSIGSKEENTTFINELRELMNYERV